MAKPKKDGMIDNIITEELSEKAVLVGLITQQQNEIKANEYLEDANTPVILKILPFILIGVAVVGAVVGIVFLIRHRRGRSWDELG